MRALENVYQKNFSEDSDFIEQLVNIMLKNLNNELKVFPPYKKQEQEIIKKTGGKALGLSSEYMQFMTQRHSKTFLEKARFSSRWTPAEKTYAKKFVIWHQYSTDILSRIANPVNGIAQNSAWHSLKQGPKRSRFNFWRKHTTWKPSDLHKRKKFKEKNQFLPNFWLSVNFPQLPILVRKW